MKNKFYSFSVKMRTEYYGKVLFSTIEDRNNVYVLEEKKFDFMMKYADIDIFIEDMDTFVRLDDVIMNTVKDDLSIKKFVDIYEILFPDSITYGYPEWFIIYMESTNDDNSDTEYGVCIKAAPSDDDDHIINY